MILLQFTNITGDSTIDAHTGWIGINSIQFGAGRAVSSTVGQSDRDTSTASFSEITCTKATDLASTGIFAASIYGKAVSDTDKCTFDLIQTGGTGNEVQVFMQVILTAPIISSYSVSSGGDRPVETFSINFAKILIKYTQFKQGSNPTPADPKGFDLTTGKPISA